MSRTDVDFDELLRQLGHTREPIRHSSLYGLSDLDRDELERFCSALGTMPADRRRRLLRALLELAESSFEVSFDAIFRRCLDDEDPTVRATAIHGLWEDSSPALVGPLLAMLRSDRSARVRAAAAQSLGRFVLACELEELDAPVAARIVDELLAALHAEDESLEVRRRALESIGYASVPEAAEALELAFYGDDERMRLSAVVGMGRSCDRRWEHILLGELASDSAAMRYEAALASGELELQTAVPALGRLLQDSDREVCNAAIWALGQIGGGAAKELLLEAYETADEDTAAALDEALAEQVFSASELDLPLYGQFDDDEAWLQEEGGLSEDDDSENEVNRVS